MWNGSAAGLRPKGGKRMGMMPSEDDGSEQAARQAKREEQLIMVNGRGCCKGEIRSSKWVAEKKGQYRGEHKTSCYGWTFRIDCKQDILCLH